MLGKGHTINFFGQGQLKGTELDGTLLSIMDFDSGRIFFIFKWMILVFLFWVMMKGSESGSTADNLTSAK